MKKYIVLSLLLVIGVYTYGMEQQKINNINVLFEEAITIEAIKKAQLRRMSPPIYREDLSRPRSKKIVFDAEPYSAINESLQKEQEKK